MNIRLNLTSSSYITVFCTQRQEPFHERVHAKGVRDFLEQEQTAEDWPKIAVISQSRHKIENSSRNCLTCFACILCLYWKPRCCWKLYLDCLRTKNNGTNISSWLICKECAKRLLRSGRSLTSAHGLHMSQVLLWLFNNFDILVREGSFIHWLFMNLSGRVLLV